MVRYKSDKKVNTWIVGLVVFILAMTITFADVYGFHYYDSGKPSGNGRSGTYNHPPGPDNNNDISPKCPAPVNLPEPTNGVPEPATLTMLVLGLGALVARKKR